MEIDQRKQSQSPSQAHKPQPARLPRVRWHMPRGAVGRTAGGDKVGVEETHPKSNLFGPDSLWFVSTSLKNSQQASKRNWDRTKPCPINHEKQNQSSAKTIKFWRWNQRFRMVFLPIFDRSLARFELGDLSHLLKLSISFNYQLESSQTIHKRVRNPLAKFSSKLQPKWCFWEETLTQIVPFGFDLILVWLPTF